MLAVVGEGPGEVNGVGAAAAAAAVGEGETCACAGTCTGGGSGCCRCCCTIAEPFVGETVFTTGAPAADEAEDELDEVAVARGDGEEDDEVGDAVEAMEAFTGAPPAAAGATVLVAEEDAARCRCCCCGSCCGSVSDACRW